MNKRKRQILIAISLPTAYCLYATLCGDYFHAWAEGMVSLVASVFMGASAYAEHRMRI
jgi:hypothetical protein